MFLYRDHRSGLAEAMDTVKAMADFEALKRHLLPIYGEGEITVKPYDYDDRIQWDTHIVCHNGHGVGFTNAPVDTQASGSAT